LSVANLTTVLLCGGVHWYTLPKLRSRFTYSAIENDIFYSFYVHLQPSCATYCCSMRVMCFCI